MEMESEPELEPTDNESDDTSVELVCAMAEQQLVEHAALMMRTEHVIAATEQLLSATMEVEPYHEIMRQVEHLHRVAMEQIAIGGTPCFTEALYALLS